MSSSNYWVKFAGASVNRRSVLRSFAIGGGGLATAALFGCTSSKGSKDASSPAVGGNVMGTATAAKQPRRGGSFSARLPTDPPGWSVLDASGPVAAAISPVYDALTALATGPGFKMGSADVVPQLAVALPEQPDPLTYVYKIRQGVKFQNVKPIDGRPLTAEDVKNSIDAIRGAGSGHRSTYEAVSSVVVQGPDTVVVKTSSPFAPLLNTSSGQFLWKVFPKELIDSKLTATTAIGSGPFIREKYEQGNLTVYKRNPDYWDTKLPYVDEMRWLVLPKTSSAAAAFKTGQLDILGELSSVEVSELAAQVKNTAWTQKVAKSGTPFTAFDSSKPPFNDVRVRRAVSMVWNREATKQALFGGETDIVSLFPSANALKPDEIPTLAANLKYDVTQAKALMAAAGLANGFDMEMAWSSRSNDQTGGVYSGELEMWSNDVKQHLKINVKPVSYEYGKWIGEVYRPPFNFTGGLWGAQRVFYADPDSYVQFWYHPKGISNQSRVNDPKITALIDKQQTQFNPRERWETLREIQKVDGETSYYMWRPGGIEMIFAQNRVHDFVSHKPDYQEYRYIWLDESK